MTDLVSERLLDRIANSGPVTVLCAAPGFRKRRLLVAFSKHWAGRRQVRFFDGIDHETNPRAAFQAILDSGPQQLVLISGCGGIDRSFAASVLERHLRKADPAKVVIAIDEPSELPIVGIESGRRVEIIGADALALSPDEIRDFLKRIALKKGRDRIAEICHTWPVAIEMMVNLALGTNLAVDIRTDADLLHLSGLYDFVCDRFLPLLSKSELAILRQASLLGTTPVELLSAGDSSDRLLAGLARRFDGLIEKIDDDLVLNPALRVFALEQAAIMDHSQYCNAMLEMADRCLAAGRLADAAQLAASAGEPHRIQGYAEEHGALLIWVLCGFSTVRVLVDKAGADVVASSPVLRMMQCIVHLKSGDIHRAEALYRNLSEDSAIRASLNRELEIVRVTLLVYGCSLAKPNDLGLLENLLSEKNAEPAWQTYLATLGCILNSQRGKFRDARAKLAEARREAIRAGSSYSRMFLEFHDAVMELAEGRPGNARDHIVQARKTWRREFRDDIGVETVMSALSASIEFETGRLTSARNALKKSAHRMPEAEAWFDIYFTAYEPMARVYLLDHGLPQTLEMLGAEQAKLRNRGLERVARLLAGMAYCLAGEEFLKGRDRIPVEAGHFADSDPTWSWQEREIYTLANVHRDVAAGRPEDAITLLSKAIDSASQSGLVRSELRYGLIRYLILVKVGNRNAAQNAAREIIRCGTATGMYQVVSQIAGSSLAQDGDMLLRDRVLDESESKFLNRLKRAIDRRTTSDGARLSSREREVVIALSHGGSDKHLARVLGITEHGVRYHLKNIYRKFQVHDRLSAVKQAKKAGEL